MFSPQTFFSSATRHGRVVLVLGNALPRAFLNSALAWLALQHKTLRVIDGANIFDAYALARYAARARRDPRVVLKKIQLARAFTCYQFAQCAAAQTFSPDAVLCLLGALDTFYDESVPLADALRLLDALCGQIRQHRAHGGLVFITAKLPPAEAFTRITLVKKLKACADDIHWLKL